MSRRLRWRRVLISVVVTLAILFLASLVGSAMLGAQRGYKFLYPARQQVCCATPNVPYQAINFQTSDALTLHGWYIPSANRAAIIVAHGLGGNRLGVLPIGEFLAKHGYGVLLIDLRAHGESDGTRYDYGWRDILAAADFLTAQPDVDPERIGAFGSSLGGVMVVEGAARDQRIKAVIADGAGAVTLDDIPPRQTLIEWWFLPYDYTNTVTIQHETGEWDLLPMVGAVKRISPRPLMLIAASGGVYPQNFEQYMNQRFFDAASDPKQLWLIDGVGHTGGYGADPARFEERIVSFFNDALR
jgi:dienelactone hydrolase